MTSKQARSLEEHELTVLAENGQVQVYRLARPGTNNLSVQLVFSRAGISIFGDLIIGPNGKGIASREVTSPQWFSGVLNAYYLCEKFLHDVWSADRATASLKEEIAEAEDHGYSPEMVKHLQSVLDHLGDDSNRHGFHDSLTDVPEGEHYETADGIPGYGYDPSDVAWLVAVQATFRELWTERSDDR